MTTGWGKLHNIHKVIGFFTSLNIPAPALNAWFVSGLEFVGGILLIVGLGSRLLGFLLAFDMLVAYLAAWARDHKKQKPTVLTVDHGLRKSSSADAKRVVQWAKDIGLEARVLKWTGAKPKSDVEAQAREARYRLLGDWCRARRVRRAFGQGAPA